MNLNRRPEIWPAALFFKGKKNIIAFKGCAPGEVFSKMLPGKASFKKRGNKNGEEEH